MERMRTENDTIEEICNTIVDTQDLLDRYDDSGVPEEMKKIIDESYSKLERYAMQCETIKKEGNVKRFVKAYTKSNSENLKELCDLLKKVYRQINSHALHAIYAQVKWNKLPQNSGFYPASSDDSYQLELPSIVDEPHVDQEGPQLHIKVNDRRNNQEELNEYHISINHEKWFYRLKRDKRSGKLCDYATLEPERMNPPLKPGKSYSFQVRAVNAKGLGEWSESTDICLDTGILGKPDKPVVASEPGTGDVKVKVAIPKTYTNHVTEVVCQHCDKENGGEWISEKLQIPGNPDAYVHTVTLTKCSPYAHHRLHIIFINKFGESKPSDTVEVPPAVPGAPTEVRRSSNYTSSMIKLRWEEPKLGEKFVDHYLIRYKRKKDLDQVDVYFLAIKVQKNKFSARATNLKSDTDYIFLISGVNADGASGPAVIIAADTRWKKAAKAALSPFVFLGGTVASTAGLLTGPVSGPIIGAVGGGVAGVVLPDSKAGSVAGGTAGTVGGAVGGAAIGTVAAIGSPVIGPIMGGAVAHRFVHGGSISDQSDEEDY
uniref:Fibronectin type-III domain-containing protein n=1 Tax=Amphimedon queenslandica TaxID=400682 RepID=A0A1X7VI34_AMPQE